MKINIITNQTPFKRGWNDFYPLFKWRKLFHNEGIVFEFNREIKFQNLSLCSGIIMIDYRYIRQRLNYNDNDIDIKKSIIEDVIKLKIFFSKVILFDSGDSTGSRLFWLTPYVDIHLKKQLLKDKSKYLENNSDKSVMVWLPENYTPSGIDYLALNEEDLPKLRLSWNLGMLDYRYFPLSKHYPIGTSALFNTFYKQIRFSKSSISKSILTVQRGCLRPYDRYSFQREILQNKLRNLESKGLPVKVGGAISKNIYLNEVRNSKAIISAFGWGEVCYRDFETIQSGCLLIKPSMEHVDTFPNVYISNQTYISVGWNLENLQEVLSDIHSNYNNYLPIIINAQKIYSDCITDGVGFVKRFLDMIK